MVSQPCVLEPSAYFLAVESQARYNVYLFVLEACLAFHRVWEGKVHVQRAACPHTPCEAELASCLTPREESCGPRDRGRECGFRVQAGHFGNSMLSVLCLPPLWFPGLWGAFHSEVLWSSCGAGGDAPGIRPCCRPAQVEGKALLWGKMNRADAWDRERKWFRNHKTESDNYHLV